MVSVKLESALSQVAHLLLDSREVLAVGLRIQHILRTCLVVLCACCRNSAAVDEAGLWIRLGITELSLDLLVAIAINHNPPFLQTAGLFLESRKSLAVHFGLQLFISSGVDGFGCAFMLAQELLEGSTIISFLM